MLCMILNVKNNESRFSFLCAYREIEDGRFFKTLVYKDKTESVDDANLK